MIEICRIGFCGLSWKTKEKLEWHNTSRFKSYLCDLAPQLAVNRLDISANTQVTKKLNTLNVVIMWLMMLINHRCHGNADARVSASRLYHQRGRPATSVETDDQPSCPTPLSLGTTRRSVNTRRRRSASAAAPLTRCMSSQGLSTSQPTTAENTHR